MPATLAAGASMVEQPPLHRHGGEATRARNRRALAAALAITAAFAAVEAIGGLLTGSLALLADAGHMVTDIVALALSLFAAWVAGRPGSPSKTYGYLRAEILAALVNGVVLVLIALVIAWEALGRLSEPAHVDSVPMLLVALAGLGANLSAATILLRAGGESLNVRGALLHVGGDALGSVGAIAAGLVILLSGWQRADAVASLVIAALILAGSWRLLHESVDVLLEGAPHRIDMRALERAMLAVPGVAAVHDVHVWTVTSGFVAMSGHAELDGSRDDHTVLDELTAMLADRFHISHVTIQPETATHAADCCDSPCEPERARPASTGVPSA
jgi:cobalt-zinc-cadmium efflux system protein